MISGRADRRDARAGVFALLTLSVRHETSRGGYAENSGGHGIVRRRTVRGVPVSADADPDTPSAHEQAIGGGRYSVDAHGAMAVQVGDRNIQIN
jgi:hypothetical protein